MLKNITIDEDMTEDDAIETLVAILSRFDIPFCIWHTVDIEDMAKVKLTPEVIEKVKDSRGWRRELEEEMTRAGYDVLRETMIDLKIPVE